MLKDIDVRYDECMDTIIRMIAEMNGNKNERAKRISKGVYLTNGFSFNTDMFLKQNGVDIIGNHGWCGVCDNYEQVIDYYKDQLDNPEKKFVITLCIVRRKDQSDTGGWRWRKWGRYIGSQNPEHEYLYDDTHIDEVFCFHVFEIR